MASTRRLFGTFMCRVARVWTSREAEIPSSELLGTLRLSISHPNGVIWSRTIFDVMPKLLIVNVVVPDKWVRAVVGCATWRSTPCLGVRTIWRQDGAGLNVVRSIVVHAPAHHQVARPEVSVFTERGILPGCCRVTYESKQPNRRDCSNKDTVMSLYSYSGKLKHHWRISLAQRELGSKVPDASPCLYDG